MDDEMHRSALHLLRPAERSDPTPPLYLPRIQGPSLTSRPSTGPRRVTPATPSGTVRPHPASLSASDPRSQPATTWPSTGPRRVTPATPSGTVRPHPASLSASDPRSQPDDMAINRSATRYTCYAQRNGPTPPRLSICLGTQGPSLTSWPSTGPRRVTPATLSGTVPAPGHR
jgi:hypothetical protein